MFFFFSVIGRTNCVWVEYLLLEWWLGKWKKYMLVKVIHKSFATVHEDRNPSFSKLHLMKLEMNILLLLWTAFGGKRKFQNYQERIIHPFAKSKLLNSTESYSSIYSKNFELTGIVSRDYFQGWEFAHSLISLKSNERLWAIRSDRSR